MPETEKKYTSVYIPTEARRKTYDNLQTYVVGAGNPILKGYAYYAPIKMIKEQRVAIGGKECDEIVVQEGVEVKLKKSGKNPSVLTVTVDELKEIANKMVYATDKTNGSKKLSENPETQEAGKKTSSKYTRFFLPVELRTKEYENIQSYRLDERYGEYAGYFVGIPKYIISANEEISSGVVCDKIASRKNNTFTLKRGSLSVKLTAGQMMDLCEKVIYQTHSGDKEYKPAINEEDAEILRSPLEEDIYTDGNRQIVFNEKNGKYMIVDDDEINFNNDSELSLNENGIRRFEEKLKEGRQVYFDSIDDAKLDFYGAADELPESINEIEAIEISKLFNDKILSFIPGEDELPTKKEFAKDYIRQKKWEQYQNYFNDKAYEKNTPYVLRNKEIFVAWKFEYFDEDGRPLDKPAKMPYNPKTGGKAMSNTPSTWSNFDVACKSVDKYGFDGIGVMAGTSKVICIDIDHCIDENGDVGAMARDIVDTLNSYCELSPSGNGLHILAFGEIPMSKKYSDLEVYNKARFLTLTGHTFEGVTRKMSSAAEMQPKIDAVWEKYIKPRLKSEEKTVFSLPSQEQTYDDEVILRKIKFGERTRGKWDRLANGLPPYEWDDEKKEYTDKINPVWYREDGSIDASLIDAAFARMLVFYNATPEQIDRIYRTLPLARDKWDRKTGDTTYGAMVIQNAFENTQNRYDIKYSKKNQTMNLQNNKNVSGNIME